VVTNAQRGTGFERAVRDDLAKRGYIVVRSTASKSPLDLVALWARPLPSPGWTWTTADGGGRWLPALLVQAKVDGRLDPDEWNVLYGLARTSDTPAVLVKRVKEGRRFVPAYFFLLGEKVSGSRKPPMLRVYPPVEVSGG